MTQRAASVRVMRLVSLLVLVFAVAACMSRPPDDIGLDPGTDTGTDTGQNVDPETQPGPDTELDADTDVVDVAAGAPADDGDPVIAPHVDTPRPSKVAVTHLGRTVLPRTQVVVRGRTKSL